MKVLFYENSAGFANYTHKLCNAVSNDTSTEVTYMTEKKNIYLRYTSNSVKKENTLLSYSRCSNKLKWLIDRIRISYINIAKRNKYIKNNKIDVVSIQATIPIIDQFFLKKIKKTAKIVYTAHDVIPPVKSFYWSKGSLKKMYDTADHIVVHTESNKAQLEDIFGIPEKKISVIHHGTDIDFDRLEKEECKKRIGITNNAPVLLFYGAIRPQKGLDILIKALNGIECDLVIAGSMPRGESFDKYEKLLEENKVNNIRFIEFVSEEFTDVLYQACDWVVLPYIYFYSQSGVFMQAIKYRKPIIATDVAGFKEYIDRYGIGVVCPEAEPDMLRNTIEAALNDSVFKSKCEENMESAALECSWENSAAKHIELFEKVRG